VKVPAALQGRQGVAVGLGVAIAAGLALGGGGLSLPFRIPGLTPAPPASSGPSAAAAGNGGRQAGTVSITQNLWGD
jgi:hypothetical protein